MTSSQARKLGIKLPPAAKPKRIARPVTLLVQDPAVTSVVVDVAVRTKSTLNTRENHFSKAKRMKAERQATELAFRGKRVPVLPVLVTFTRRSAGTCDEGDGLPSTCKAIRDEIAAMYGVGDSPRDPITWRYAQVKCKRGDFGVTVTIHAGAPHAAA